MKHWVPCSFCGQSAEADWTLLDDGTTWQSYWIACTNESCDTMLSLEVPIVKDKHHRKLIEQSLRVTWNHLHEL